MSTEPRFLLLLVRINSFLVTPVKKKKKGKTILQHLPLPIVLRRLSQTGHRHYIGQVPVASVYLGRLMNVLKFMLMSNPQS